MGVVIVVRYYQIAPVVLFTFYLVYGLVRPLISKGWRKYIESAIEEDEEFPEDNREEGEDKNFK